MLILSRVCADFYDKRNNLLFRITQKDLGLFVDAPEGIRDAPEGGLEGRAGTIEKGSEIIYLNAFSLRPEPARPRSAKKAGTGRPRRVSTYSFAIYCDSMKPWPRIPTNRPAAGSTM